MGQTQSDDETENNYDKTSESGIASEPPSELEPVEGADDDGGESGESGGEITQTADEYLGDHQSGGSHREIEDVRRGLLARLKDRVTKHRRAIHPRRLDDALKNRITERAKAVAMDGDGRLLRIRPYKDGQGITGGKELFKELAELHKSGFLGFGNNSPTEGFEIWMVEGEVTFHIYAHDQEAEVQILQEIDAQYPNAKVERVWDATTIEAHVEREIEASDGELSYSSPDEVPLSDAHLPLPPIKHAQYAAGTELTLRREAVYPLLAPDAAEDMENDPYASVTSSMIADKRNHFMVQVTFRPLGIGWADSRLDKYLPWRTSVDWAAYEWRAERENITTDPTDPGNVSAPEDQRDPTEAKHTDWVHQRDKEQGFAANIRVIGIGADKEIVRRGTKNVVESIQSKYAHRRQKLISTPMNGINLIRTLDRVISRSYISPARFPRRKRRYRRLIRRQYPVKLPVSEMGTLCHLPNGEIDTPDIDWERTRAGAPVPQAAESFGETAAETDAIPATTKPQELIEAGGTPTSPQEESTVPTKKTEENEPMTDNSNTTTQESDGGGNVFGTPDGEGEDEFEGDKPAIEEAEKATRVTNADGGDDNTSESEGGGSGPVERISWLQNLIQEDEDVLYADNPSRWASMSEYLIGFALSLAGVALGYLTVSGWSPVPDLVESLPTETLFLAAGLGLGGLLYAGYEHVRRKHKWYVVTNKRVMRKSGILGESTPKLWFEDITNEEKYQSFMDRHRGIGTIRLYSSATGEREMDLDYVRRVNEVEGLISTYQNEANTQEVDF